MELPAALQSITSCISYGLVYGLVTDMVQVDFFVASLLLLCCSFASLLLLFLFVCSCVCVCVVCVCVCVWVCVCVCVVVVFFCFLPRTAAHHQSTTFC